MDHQVSKVWGNSSRNNGGLGRQRWSGVLGLIESPFHIFLLHFLNHKGRQHSIVCPFSLPQVASSITEVKYQESKDSWIKRDGFWSFPVSPSLGTDFFSRRCDGFEGMHSKIFTTPQVPPPPCSYLLRKPNSMRLTFQYRDPQHDYFLQRSEPNIACIRTTQYQSLEILCNRRKALCYQIWNEMQTLPPLRGPRVILACEISIWASEGPVAEKPFQVF